MSSRRASFVALSVVAALGLSACGSGGSTSSDAIELDFWTEWDAEPDASLGVELVEAFNDAHPDIKINYRAIENESFFTLLRNSFTSNEPPEVFQHEANTNLFQFVEVDGVLPVTDWWNKPGNGDRFAEGSESAVSWEGEVYGLPLGTHTTNQLYYNKALLEEHGIDPTTFTTWDDFLDAFAQLKDAGVAPIAYGNSEGWPGSQWFYTFLAKWVGAEKVNQLVARNCGYKWTDPDIVEAAQLYVDLADEGYFSSGAASDDYPTATATLFSGRAAFFHTGSWFISELEEAPEDFDYGMVTFPEIPGGNGKPTDVVAAVLAGLSISTSADTDAKREAALTFIDWLTQPEQAERFVEIGSISSTAAANEKITNPLTLQVVEEQLEPATGAIGFIEHQTPKQVGEEAIWEGSTAVLTGQATADSWMEDLESAASEHGAAIKVEENCS